MQTTKKPRATIRETDAAGTADVIALGANKDGTKTKLVTLILQRIFAISEIVRQTGQRIVRPVYACNPVVGET